MLARIAAAARRSWWILLIGAGLTAFAVVQIRSTSGVYVARTTITVDAPADSSTAGNQLTSSTATLVGFAKLVETRVNGTFTTQLFASPDVPLYTTGIRRGTSVFVPDYGGQWASNMNQPLIIVDVVDTTATRAAERMRSAVTNVEDVATRAQQDDGVAGSDQIDLVMNPAQPEVGYVGPSMLRATAGTATLGGCFTLAACVIADRFRLRRRIA